MPGFLRRHSTDAAQRVSVLGLEINWSKAIRKTSLKKIVSGFKRRGREILAYIRAWLKRANIPDNKFVIFAQGRTGSWLLYDLLNLHPEIHCDKEILSKKVFSPKLHVKGRCLRWPKVVYGFHVQIYQLMETQKIDPKKFLSNLHKNGWKIIYLRRLNILRQSVSVIIAQTRQKYYDTSANPLKGIYIECDELIGWLERREINLMKEKEALDGLPHIRIVYEEDLLRAEKHQKTLDTIFDYLGISSVPVKTKLARISSDQMPDFIQNYEEVVCVISKTKYAKFLAN